MLKISENGKKELKIAYIYDTSKYRYQVDSYRGDIYRIELDALSATACLSHKTDLNPYGWEKVGNISEI